MNKVDKIKKGIVKVFDFEKECECVKTKSFMMTVTNKKYKVCEVCHGDKKRAKIKSKKENLKVISSSLSVYEEKRLNRIEQFLNIAKKEGFEMMISRQNIIDLERKYHIKRPVWLMKDKKFNIGLGAYSLLRAYKELEVA